MEGVRGRQMGEWGREADGGCERKADVGSGEGSRWRVE
jgi:hypothetical protein